MSAEKRPQAIELSHHLSDLAKARQVSPLKGLQKFMLNKDTIVLAGGLPHPDYFPFADVSANVLVHDAYSLEPSEERSSSLSWVWKLFGAGSSKEKTTGITIPKYVSDANKEVNLATALQYGTAQGIVPLQKFIKEFSAKVYQPAYENWTILLHGGNTDAWTRAILTLCNSGDYFIVEEWTYPSALASAAPYNIRPIPVAMDSEGLRPDHLRKTLAEWDQEARGARRPHVIYTVPVGQNPSGATMGAERKKAIYDICVEFDVIIVEDDPYYFLQQGVYRPKSERSVNTLKHETDKFVSSLAPSYLKFDYQGRVIRLDTFSKASMINLQSYIAPGSRLGWFTCAPLLAERLERQGETTTQAPCGFGQSLISQLFKTWQYDGYVRWLHGLATEYRSRRDYLIDTLNEEFQVSRTVGTKGVWEGSDIFEFSFKATEMSEKLRQRKLFSLVPPTSGMFLWFALHFENVPGFRQGDEETLEEKLWETLAKKGLLVAPGWFFASTDDVADAGEGHFRISFSNAEYSDMKKAIGIFAAVLREFFKEH
ncbi:PLP-dependent transferase [Irpex rosettiformis]|uniref:PLP-dependent transferase n=1 Tax=Irpex rosettiformis TaxID=378272 RepID=A0ACB8U4E8_9APHY|nr:PLP-dependent transferase [Irpex rosettiformis]